MADDSGLGKAILGSYALTQALNQLTEIRDVLDVPRTMSHGALITYLATTKELIEQCRELAERDGHDRGYVDPAR